jgi:4-hydroxy-2-oxoheptanedioate aldolase
MHHSHGTTARTSERLRAAWGGGEATYGLWSTLPDMTVAELIAGLSYDYVIVDLQHGVTTFADLPVMAQVMRGAGSAPIVRVPSNDPAQIMRALDCGAAGVIVPLIDSAAEARAAVEPCRFPPAGTRSWGPMWGYVRSDGALAPEAQDAQAICLVMIETAGALEAVDEVVATPGIDGIYIGPNDLALACGYGRQTYRDSPEVAGLIQRVVDACRAAGLAAGLHCSDPAMAREWVGRGATMVTIAQDTALLAEAATAALEDARGAADGSAGGSERPAARKPY